MTGGGAAHVVVAAGGLGTRVACWARFIPNWSSYPLVAERDTGRITGQTPARQRGRRRHQVKMAAGAPEMTGFYRAKL